MHLKLDINGNLTLYPQRIQTNGNLPRTHRDGIGEWTGGEVAEYKLQITGTKTTPLSDKRYSITQEFTGHASGKAQYVIRFCGGWVDSRSTYTSALVRANGARSIRGGAVAICEVVR
jgi:hypothetical protein